MVCSCFSNDTPGSENPGTTVDIFASGLSAFFALFLLGRPRLHIVDDMPRCNTFPLPLFAEDRGKVASERNR